ncbi:efflux RND transporter permease subunit [Shigella flexneri]
MKKVYVQRYTLFRMLPDNINQWYVRNASGTMAPLSAYSSTEWTYGFTAIGTLQRHPVNGDFR